MADKHRGEADIVIDGKTYPVTLNMGAISRIGSAFGCETLSKIFQVVADPGPRIVELYGLLLEASGHKVEPAAIERISVWTHGDFANGLFAGRDDKAAGSGPQKAQS